MAAGPHQLSLVADPLIHSVPWKRVGELDAAKSKVEDKSASVETILS